MVRALTMFLVPRQLLCFVVAHLMQWCFGISPEYVKRLNRLLDDVCEREADALEREACVRLDLAEEKARHAATGKAVELAQTSNRLAVHAACRYRNALKSISQTKTHGRAVLLAKEATKARVPA